MLYTYFVTGTNLANVADAIVQVIARKFNIIGEVSRLLDSLMFKLKVIYNSFDGKFTWWELGGVIFDIGSLVLTFVPAAKIGTVVAALWEISSIL